MNSTIGQVRHDHAPPPDEAVAELIASYSYAIDDGDIDRWPGFFAARGVYHVTTRENHDAGLPIGLMRCDGRGMMVDRMKALRDANIFEPHSYNHVVSQPLITSRGPASVSVRTNFHVVRIMEDGRIDLFATGKYLDKIVVEEGQARFSERIVVLDSRCVDVLLVLPF